MKKKLFVSLLLLACMALLQTGCQRRSGANINIEQAGHPLASRILTPGFGTVGVIDDGKVYVYHYLSEKQEWILDKLSQFMIPENNNGLITFGMGTIGVVAGRSIQFYQLDAYNNWVSNPRYTFALPKRFDRIIGVRMPWEMGMLAVEHKGLVDFFYFDGSGEWVRDETATFRIPRGIDHCFSLGDMTMAIADGKKLGVYYLHPEGYWDFVEEFVLQLPEGYDAIIPWESGFIAVLMGNVLEFFQLDPGNDRWLHLEDMAFMLPGVYLWD